MELQKFKIASSKRSNHLKRAKKSTQSEIIY